MHLSPNRYLRTRPSKAKSRKPTPAAWRYRRVVPAPLRAIVGKLEGRASRSEWVETFGVHDDPAAIYARTAQLAREHDSVLAKAWELRKQADGPDIEFAKRQAAKLNAKPMAQRVEIIQRMQARGDLQKGQPFTAAFFDALENKGKPRASLTLSALYARDKERHSITDHGPRNEEPVKSAMDSLIARIGDKHVASVTPDDVYAWVADCKARDHKDSTIRRRRNSLRAMFQRFAKDEQITKTFENPFDAVTVKGAADADDKHPFKADDFTKLDSYLAKGTCGPDTLALFAMMKSSGAGPAEIGGLVIGDVMLDADVPHIKIRPNVVRSLKTTSRKRDLPLIGDALTAARDAVKRAKDNPDGQLFMAFDRDKRGADAISAKLNKAIRAAGITDPKKSAYSFRHSLIGALKASGCHGTLSRMIAGHAAKDSHDRYGSPDVFLADAKAAIEKALPRLGQA